MSVRVLIADDQQLIRDGFRMILAADADVKTTEAAERGHFTTVGERHRWRMVGFLSPASSGR